MEKIEGILQDLEKTNEIKILYAVEAGSRAWGFDSNDSDFDIRFIFIHENRKKYLGLNKFKESIDGFSQDRIYDWQGWDITKCLNLIKKINPTIIEWLYSPIVYYKDAEFEKTINLLKNLLIKQNRISPLLNHYKSMAKSNYISHIKGKNEVEIKKYLYVIRPIGMFKWLLVSNKNNNFIHVNFNKVLEDLRPHLSNDIIEKINEIIYLKKNSSEKSIGRKIECVDKWIMDTLENKSIEEIDKSETNEINDDEYDRILINILKVEFK